MSAFVTTKTAQAKIHARSCELIFHGHRSNLIKFMLSIAWDGISLGGLSSGGLSLGYHGVDFLRVESHGVGNIFHGMGNIFHGVRLFMG